MIIATVVRAIPTGPGRWLAAWGLRDAVIRFRRESKHDHALETCFYVPEFLGSWRLEEFHRGASAHYLGLKAEHAVTLTDLPAELMTTLGRAEAAMRRARKDPSIDLSGATAPQLRPGAPLVKPSTRPRVSGDPTGQGG